ncbi:hypothetical protein LUU34_00396300 [Aix galericulata]|nr:hypothetical protein LUU34_00396300 [Aix galericulata]
MAGIKYRHGPALITALPQGGEIKNSCLLLSARAAPPASCSGHWLGRGHRGQGSVSPRVTPSTPAGQGAHHPSVPSAGRLSFGEPLPGDAEHRELPALLGGSCQPPAVVCGLDRSPRHCRQRGRWNDPSGGAAAATTAAAPPARPPHTGPGPGPGPGLGFGPGPGPGPGSGRPPPPLLRARAAPPAPAPPLCAAAAPRGAGKMNYLVRQGSARPFPPAPAGFGALGGSWGGVGARRSPPGPAPGRSVWVVGGFGAPEGVARPPWGRDGGGGAGARSPRGHVQGVPQDMGRPRSWAQPRTGRGQAAVPRGWLRWLSPPRAPVPAALSGLNAACRWPRSPLLCPQPRFSPRRPQQGAPEPCHQLRRCARATLVAPQHPPWGRPAPRAPGPNKGQALGARPGGPRCSRALHSLGSRWGILRPWLSHGPGTSSPAGRGGKGRGGPRNQDAQGFGPFLAPPPGRMG